MSFGQNLQCLRKLRNKITQEQLAENLGVSRQTVSKWELDIVYPEMDKVIELCDLFSCTMDELIREDLNMIDDAYKVLMTHMKINDMKHKQSKEIIPCFEKEYVKAGIANMDIHIALE